MNKTDTTVLAKKKKKRRGHLQIHKKKDILIEKKI